MGIKQGGVGKPITTIFILFTLWIEIKPFGTNRNTTACGKNTYHDPILSRSIEETEDEK